MTQHITQEVAVELSIKAGDEFAIHEAEFYTNLCNAALAEPKKAEDMVHRRLGTNGGVPYNEQLAISRRWDRAVDAGSPITARSEHGLP